ncbi:hypothetical protein [Brevundimonas sp.]|uniref:hypothetical protein n=1 Tax=Brevundimonas sp. TaxID=1871086 RepID=UPI002FC769EF
MSRKDFSAWAIFGAPLALAVLSLTGLVGALLNDGVWDWIGAVLLGATVAAAGWARFRAGRRRG